MSGEDTSKFIYTMSGVAKVYDNRTVIKDISLSFYYGAKIGVLGLNGSGKSTLLKIFAGVETEFEGTAVLTPGYSVGYLEQEPLRNETRTVREVVADGVRPTLELIEEFNAISEKFAEPMDDEQMNRLIERQGELQEQIDHRDAWDIDSRLDMAMDALRCPPDDMPVDKISGGERRRVALVRLLLQQPDMLLLDEPTNHLDAESVAWLEQHLQRYQGTIIAVTHDRYFLDNAAEWILELDRGHGIPFRGNYTSWLEQKQARLAQEEKSEARRVKTLEREFEWIKMSPRGRHAKSKARISAYENLLNQQADTRNEDLQIFIPPGPRLGDKVIEAKELTKAFDDTVLFENLSFSLPPGGIVGVIGPNGAGKTTLFRLLTGREKPSGGELSIGETVRLAYVDQKRDILDNDKTVYEEISGGSDTIDMGGREINARAYTARFNFPGSDQQKRVGTLSGGERNRVHLARILLRGANVLLLDEPTNDLDVNTMRALEDGLLNFAGCAVVISHDRWFLDRIATHILAFEGDSAVRWFDGNFTEYEEDRKRRLGAEAQRPHRIKYRHLTR